MSEYTVFPSMDENLQFPPSVRAAIAAYPELLAYFAPKANPTFTGTVAGITKAHVGLSNVSNTSDANKPVSTAQQTALNLKANLDSPTFTGTVGGITKAMVGLGSVDNTSDTNKPVSTAQRTEIEKSALGLVWQDVVSTVAGSTANAVINSTPSFTFKANRRYRIVWDASYYQTPMTDQHIWSINSAPVGDAAGSLSNLTVLNSRAKGALGANGFTQNNGTVSASVMFTSNTTVQLKFRVQRTVGTGSLTIVGAPHEQAYYSIYDDGIM